MKGMAVTTNFDIEALVIVTVKMRHITTVTKNKTTKIDGCTRRKS